jgi:nitrogen regulation protein NR(I)
VNEISSEANADKCEILVVDDEKSMRRVLRAMLEKQGYKVHTAVNGREAIEVMEDRMIFAIISDIKMPIMDGMELLDRVLHHYRDTPVILITAHGTVDNAVAALKKGAFDYITKPFDMQELQNVVKKAVDTRKLNSLDYNPLPQEPGYCDIIGRSPQMMEIYDIITKVADTPSTVLITGEHGTGKELVARALHQNSARSHKPFITINCAAIPQNLMESELFGYEKGAFTGAVSSKAGRFELADQGTLFLDEIGEIPIDMQVKLLRVLQYGQFERVGGIQTIKVDVRLVAATNRALEEMIREGTFRQDLYYRLKVVPIKLPPLRDRCSDIPLLLKHFLQRFNQRLKKNIREVTPEAIEYLQSYEWPGNIRELENLVERALLFAEGSVIAVQDLPQEFKEHGCNGGPKYIKQSESDTLQKQHKDESGEDLQPKPHSSDNAALSLPEMWRQEKERLEYKMISQALIQTEHNVTQAAKILGISRKSLQKKMKELGLREN